MKELDSIYKQLKDKDSSVAEKYKLGVFDHIERIRVKAGIGELEKIPDEAKQKPSNDSLDVMLGLSFDKSPVEKDVNLIKLAILHLVDYLA